MLSHLSALVVLRSGQSASGVLVPAAQQVLAHLHRAGFATKAKPSPPYLKELNKESVKKSKAENKDKAPRALSAYTCFVKEQASLRKGEASSSAELMKLIAQDWKSLSDQQKKPYNDLAAKSKGEATAAKDKAKASRGPPTGYNIWCAEVVKDLRASNPSMKAPDMMKEAAARWRSLPEGEKDRRNAAAKAARDAWKAQLPAA